MKVIENVLDQPGLDIDRITQKRLEKFVKAPVKWVEEPEVHEVLGVHKNKVRRINAVI